MLLEVKGALPMQSKDEMYLDPQKAGLDPQQTGGYFARVFVASDARERICTHADPHAGNRKTPCHGRWRALLFGLWYIQHLE